MHSQKTEKYSIWVSQILKNKTQKVFGKARIKGIKSKDFVKEQIEKRYKTKKWCKTTSRGNWDKRNIDMYDALTMSLFEEKT